MWSGIRHHPRRVVVASFLFTLLLAPAATALAASARSALVRSGAGAACAPNAYTWMMVPSPNPGAGANQLSGIAALSSRDIWAVGDWGALNSGGSTLTEHWNGLQWSVVPSAQSGVVNVLVGVAGDASSDVWAVGYYYPSGVANTFIERDWCENRAAVSGGRGCGL